MQSKPDIAFISPSHSVSALRRIREGWHGCFMLSIYVHHMLNTQQCTAASDTCIQQEVTQSYLLSGNPRPLSSIFPG